MNSIRFALAVLVLFFSSNAHAFDPNQCRRIADVALPYDVKADSTSVTFLSASERIVLRSTDIEAGARMLRGPQVGPYYGAVRRFLDRARTMANAALPFRGSNATMGAAATDMCSAILDVAASSAAVEQAFPGFVSPVRVKLD